jgi:hypothetical protein
MTAPESLPWAPLAGALMRLYGLPAWSFREFGFWRLPGAETIYVAVAGAVHPTTPEELAIVGWPVLTAPLPAGRPTPELLRRVGADAAQNVVEVDEAGEAAFARGDALSIPPEATAEVLVVRRGRHALGGVDRANGRRFSP